MCGTVCEPRPVATSALARGKPGCIVAGSAPASSMCSKQEVQACLSSCTAGLSRLSKLVIMQLDTWIDTTGRLGRLDSVNSNRGFILERPLVMVIIVIAWFILGNPHAPPCLPHTYTCTRRERGEADTIVDTGTVIANKSRQAGQRPGQLLFLLYRLVEWIYLRSSADLCISAIGRSLCFKAQEESPASPWRPWTNPAATACLHPRPLGQLEAPLKMQATRRQQPNAAAATQPGQQAALQLLRPFPHHLD